MRYQTATAAICAAFLFAAAAAASETAPREPVLPALPAEQPAPANPPAQPGSQPPATDAAADEVVCRKEEGDSSTRLGGRKICRKQKEWDALDAEAKKRREDWDSL